MDSVTMFAVWSPFTPLFLESSTSTAFDRHLRKCDTKLFCYICHEKLVDQSTMA